MANQDLTINSVFFGIRRRYLAWRWKYAVPIEINVDGEIGGYGVNKWCPSGTFLAQVSNRHFILAERSSLNIDLYFYLVLASLFLRHVHVHLGRRSTSQIQEVPLVIRSE